MLRVPIIQLSKWNLNQSVYLSALIIQLNQFLADTIFAEVRKDEYPEDVVDATESKSDERSVPYSLLRKGLGKSGTYIPSPTAQ